MMKLLKNLLILFLVITIIGIGIPHQEPAKADLISGAFGFIGAILGFLCDILEAIDDAVEGLTFGLIDIGIGDMCAIFDDLADLTEQLKAKYPQPKVNIDFLDDFEGGLNGEPVKAIVRATASPYGYSLDADGNDNYYATWSINGDYKYNATLAGGDVVNRWGTLVKNGSTYQRIGGDGYDAWKAEYNVDSGADDDDDDGFEAAYGGANGRGEKCTNYLNEDGSVNDIDCDTMGHEFSKMKAQCPDGTSGVIGDGVFNACEEFTWGTNPTMSATEGDKDIGDEKKLAGVGGNEFFYYLSDVEDTNPNVTVFIEGTTYRPYGYPGEEANPYYYIMKVQTTKTPYDDDDYLNVKIIRDPEWPEANGEFIAAVEFQNQIPENPDLFNYRWKFWRKGADPNAEGVLVADYALKEMTYPGELYPALTEGTYYLELQVCNIQGGVRKCGKSIKDQVNVGGESAINMEGLVGNTSEDGIKNGLAEFQPIETILQQDVIRLTAECYVDPSLTDSTLGCDASGYKYVWDITVGNEESGKKIDKAYDGGLTYDPTLPPTSINTLNNPSSIIFSIPDDATYLKFEVKGVGLNKQDIKIAGEKYDVKTPNVEINILEGGQKEAGSLNSGAVYAGQTVALEVLPGPAGSTFEIRGNRNELAYDWRGGSSTGNDKYFEFQASNKLNFHHTITVYGVNLFNIEQVTESNRLVLKVIEGPSVLGASSWTSFPKKILAMIYPEKGKVSIFTYAISFFVIISISYILGRIYRKRQRGELR